MKVFCIALVLFSIWNTPSQAQHNSKYQLLDRFVEMHNIATDQAIEDFISTNYLPEVLTKLDLDKQKDFYKHIIKEFGPLNQAVYEKVEETPTKLIVQLIKENEPISNKEIDPAEILMVEIDVSADQPNYLSRGLGLGALVCSIRNQ